MSLKKLERTQNKKKENKKKRNWKEVQKKPKK